MASKGSCRVFVCTRGKGLPKWVTSHHLKDHFSSLGRDIEHIAIVRAHGAQEVRLGMVTFTSRAVAENAIQKLDGSMLLLSEERLCLNLKFFREEKKTNTRVTPSTALKKKPSQQVKPTQGPVACTEAKETKQSASSAASMPLRSAVTLSSDSPPVDGSTSNSSRGRHSKRRSSFPRERSNLPKRSQMSSILSPPSSPAPSDPGTKVAIRKDSCSKVEDQVNGSVTHEKCNSPNPTSVPYPSTAPVMLSAKQVLCMSEYRYNFFMKQFPEDVKRHQQRGGKVSYLRCRGKMAIEAPTKDILCKFVNKVGKTGEIKQYLSPDQWKSVQSAKLSSDDDSYFEKILGSDLSAEIHQSCSESQVLLVVGMTEEIVKAGNYLVDYLNIELFPGVCLNIEACQMKALCCILPNLPKEIFNQYRVKVDGFLAKSTCLILKGLPAMISQAKADINAKVSSISFAQVDFPHPHSLIRSVQRRFDQIQVSLLPSDEEPDASTAPEVSSLQLHLCSLSEDSLKEAKQVLKDGPFKDTVILASSSPELTTAACTELESEVAVATKVQESSQNSTSLLIQGYVFNDVRLACRRLLVEFRVMKRSLSLSSVHVAYLKILLLDTASEQEEGELLCRSLHDLAVRVTFKSVTGMNKVCLTGVSRAIESALDQILQALSDLNSCKFDYTYDLYFLEQIEQKVLNPIQTEKKCVYYCVERKPKQKVTASSTPATFSITIFSKNSESFRETCEAMKAVCLYSSSHSIHSDALTIKKELLNDVASKHGAKIELVSKPKPLLVIRTLCKENAIFCWKDMDKFIASAIKTTEEVVVDVCTAKYIQSKHADEIAEFRQQCDIQFPQQLGQKTHSTTSSLPIRIKGNIGVVNKACKRIKEVSEQCKVEKVTLQCPLKYLSMWRKRWEEFKDEQEVKFDIMIEFNCQPLSKAEDLEVSEKPTPHCNSASSTFFICGEDHEGIAATVQLLLGKENGQLLTESILELSEEKQIEILQTGLEMKEIVGPHIKYSLCMNIKKETRTIKLTAPESWGNRLCKAKAEILEFIGDQTQVEDFICDDRVVGLVLTSPSYQFYSQLKKVAKDSNISIQPFREPHPGFKLCGPKTSVDLFKFKAKDLISSHIMPMIGRIVFPVSSLELSILSSDTLHHLQSKLQEELCIVYQNLADEDGACAFDNFVDLEDTARALFPIDGKMKHWFWKNDNGQLVPYPSEVSDALTAVHVQHSADGYYWVCPENGNQYCIDLARMEQRNTATGVARKVSLQTAEYRWSYLNDHGVSQPYDHVLSSHLEHRFSQGIRHYDIGGYSFDMKQMVMIKPIERPMTREIAAILTHIPENIKAKKPKDRASIVIRGPKKKLKLAKSRIMRELSETILTKDLDLPPHSTSDFEQNLKRIAAGRRNISISIITKGNDAVSSTKAKVLRIKGLKQSIDEMVIKIQGEIIKFQSLKTSEPYCIPPEWETQDKTVDVQLFEVQYNSSEWFHVTGLFQQTLPAFTVLSVKRIQNVLLWKKYSHHKAILHQKNSGRVNEMELFHGTRGTDPKRIFQSEEGFDMRFSNEGRWGQANYFAVNSSYSNAYARMRHNGKKEMLLAKVLTGVSVRCESDQTLRMPPLRNEASGGIECRYDSVCGVTQGSVVYMTYSNDKAYPAYLIQYEDCPNRTQSARQQAYASAPVPQHTGTSQTYRTQSRQQAYTSAPVPQHTGTSQFSKKECIIQ